MQGHSVLSIFDGSWWRLWLHRMAPCQNASNPRNLVLVDGQLVPWGSTTPGKRTPASSLIGSD